MAIVPNVVSHEVVAGRLIDGEATDGTADATLHQRGRQMFYKLGTHGGLFEAHENLGFDLYRLLFKGEGATQVDISLLDPDDVEYVVHTETANPESFVFPDVRAFGACAPPGWKLKVTATCMTVADEVIGTGDDNTFTFNDTLANLPVLPGSVSVTDGVETFTDDGAGVLTGDAGGSGTVNYTTGAIEVTFHTEVVNAIDVLVDYSTGLTSNGRCTIFVNASWGQYFDDLVTSFPSANGR